MQATSFLVGSAALLAACAFDPGDPWGRLEPELSAAFAPGPGRLTDEGRLATTTDYAVDVAELATVFDSITVSMQGAGAAAFDPADPPEGFSLCHGGHCHADDGRLVPYDEVAVEAGAGTGGGSLTAITTRSEIPLGPDPSPVAIASCADRCWLERGSLHAVEVLVVALRLRGRVFDRRPGDARRLPEEGVPVQATWPLQLILRAPVEATVDDDHPVGVRLDALAAVPEQLFDGIDWAQHLPADPGDLPVDLTDADAVARRVAENLAEHGALDVHIERF